MAANTAYGASAQEIAALFADYLEGDATRPALAISQHPLPEIARTALERSFEAFEYKPPTCTYVTITPRDANAEGGDIPLDSQALFLLAESLDPLFVIAADEPATRTLAQAYRMQLAGNASTRVFGRPAATFADLPQLLATETGKQKAWQILKSFR